MIKIKPGKYYLVCFNKPEASNEEGKPDKFETYTYNDIFRLRGWINQLNSEGNINIQIYEFNTWKKCENLINKFKMIRELKK